MGKISRSRMGVELADNTVWSYSYDGLNQLTGAVRRDETETAVNSMTYAYDQIGNRLESEEDGASAAYVANLLNQYTQINETECTYDANGNMLTNLGWTYTWNTENRLTVAEKDNISVEFDYDYAGRRAVKKVYQNNILTRHEKYVYNGFKLIAIYDVLNADARTHSFVWQPVALDVPLCMTHGGTEYYHLTDGNKNVTELTDASGETVESYQYGPFGQILTENSQINPFQFSSEFRDPETALIYYNYRYYDPNLGRWAKRDPIEEQGGINLYGMIGNGLINLVDHLGLSVYTPYVGAELGKASHESLEKKFMCWYEKERKDMGWVSKLKRCPKNLKKVYGLIPLSQSKKYQLYMANPYRQPALWPDKIRAVVSYENPEPSEWVFEASDKMDQAFTYVGKIYHPGGKYELRTKNPSTYGNAGNQCIYDCNGKMITAIPAAGTADKISPNFDKSQHYKQDVQPFNWALLLGKNYVQKYYEVRPIW